MKKYFIVFLFLSLLFPKLSTAQEGVPIYHDYLSDNLFLLHPSMAGASTCAKARLTGRMQWFSTPDSPMLQTFSLHSHFGENGANGFGVVILNDRNGFHSQKGIQLAYAHHLDFGNGADINKLSFGIAGSFFQNQLDETSFDPARVDPIIAGIVQSDFYYNFDVGLSYHVENFFFNATLKNVLLMSRNLYTGFESPNVRNLIGSMGYYTGGQGTFHVEPSVMVQYKDYNGQIIVDGNMKFYLDLSLGNSVYFGASYRRDLEESMYDAYHNITPILGAKIGRYTFAYTYTHQLLDIPFSNSGFHQITLGYNFNCRRLIQRIGCPEIR